MPVREANAQWKGSLTNGNGTMALGSGAFEGQYSYGSRFEGGVGTNPEELIGAAHAGCLSMALAGALGGAGHDPEEITSNARVHLCKDGDAFTIKTIELQTTAIVSGVSEDEFRQIAEDAKANCPVSRALTGVDIELKAELAAA
ncbi:MAG TPA: OsmC family peroxiredoxin [Solirubrobacterales bacterium]|nr:OsmC family peroxiredoxin [Solirubrobacterales bacterium]